MNVAIVSFDGVTEKLRRGDNGSWHPFIKSARTGAKGVVLDLDINFDGFTPISDVETDVKHNIDFIVVHGWGSHAYGGFCYKGDGARTSWLHKAIVGMKLCEDSSPDLLSIYGLLQFGVPNGGMNIDALVCMVKDKPSRHVLEHLQPHIGHGRRQKDQEEFCDAFNYQGSEVRYFFETRKSPTVTWDDITKKWGMNGKEACAVSESEACHLRRKEVHAEVSVPMDYNHSDMVKLRPGDENGYSKIRQVIERFVEKAPSVIQIRFEDNPRNQNHDTAGYKNTESAHDMENQGTQDCLKSLSCNNMKRDITPYNNTCQWIQTNPKYQGWRRRLNGLLWMRGKPGSGKSTVMSYIQRNNDRKDPTENSSTAFYFFSGQGTSFQRSQIGLLQSLLHQIVSTVPSQLRRVQRVYEEKKRSGENLELQWSSFELQDLFRQMFAFPDIPPIRLYIDALDEANEDSPNEILFFFQSILENPATRLSICFTCRHFPNLGVHDPGLDIDVEQENTDDIITYIDHFLKANSQRGRNNNWIVNEIAKKSNNIFQWVVMITSRVSKLQRSGSSEQTILNFLNSPNLDLGKLYRGTLEKIEPSDRPESLKLLQWVCFSLRSLTVDEMRYAMAIGSTRPTIKHHSGWSEAFARNFNHSTPLDYLKQWNTENMYGQTPIWIAAAKGHVNVLKTIPLQARSICLNQTDKKGISVLISALRGRHDDVIAFLLDSDTIDINQRYFNGKTPLLDCAEREYAEGLERILSHPHLDINLQDPNGKTPLMICAEKGYQTGLQKILCHENLNINFQDYEGKTALHIAVHCQNIEVVEGLMGCELMMPADRFIQDRSGSTPLHVAVWDRNFEMVETILTYHTGEYNAAKVVSPGSHGGGLDYQDNCGNTAILVAMDDPPDYDIVEILADDHGADWRIENKNGYNVYDLAREKGEQYIIKMLEGTETTTPPEITPPHDGYTHTFGMEGLELDPTEAMPRDFMDLDGISDIRGRKRQFDDLLSMPEAHGHRNKSLRRF
ncbi:hypothetical protein HYALB_00013142 [Hymenoscyphus albidus]|uniref:Nephrocystin 3-like N-terminal domain-containing protein n=1 Tax=Hymenoscyphus albidus TaxID=595503 RepID=A0A9N9Q4B4_9HELO|nr:hypothetical protein HYALB_00013142 [Hymenoscyphus albidus]